MAKILYFGRLGDTAGMAEESIALPTHVATAGALRQWLDARFDADGVLLEPTVRIAVNNEISLDGTAVNDDDEIALMPPVGGG